jgi:putative glutamine amidotransferase
MALIVWQGLIIGSPSESGRESVGSVYNSAMAPRVGITVDHRDNTATSGKYEAAIAYSRAVRQAGGLAVLLPHEPGDVEAYLDLCDGLILTGGGDPATEPFGETTDPRARVIDPARQAFELGLIEAAANHAPYKPVLGICLGMQLMALHAGGRLDQYLPETLGDQAAQAHQDDRRHELSFHVAASVLWQGARADALGQAASVVSSHRQAVADPGSLRVVATAADGTIEAIDDPGRAFYLGVQWHPERGEQAGALSLGVIQRLIDAARCAR